MVIVSCLLDSPNILNTLGFSLQMSQPAKTHLVTNIDTLRDARLVHDVQCKEVQTLKSFKKVAWKPARIKNMYFDPMSPKSYQNGVPKPKQNQKTQSMDPKISFLMLRSTPGSSHGPPGCKTEAEGMPYDRFWAPDAPDPDPKIIKS